MSKDIEKINKIIKEGKPTEVDETFEKVSEVFRKIPGIKEKKEGVLLARGMVLELSTIMEESFNALLSRMGGNENPEKNTFMEKAKSVEELMLKDTSDIKREQFEMFQDFVSLRNIFSHVPINWFSQKLEFKSEGGYESYFKRNHKWKDFSFAINYFTEIMGSTLELIRSFVKFFLTHAQMKKEINKAVFGVDMPEEIVEKLKETMEEEILKRGEKMEEQLEEWGRENNSTPN